MSLVDNPEVARCLFREAIDAQLLIDPRDSRVLDANPAALRLTGLAAEAIVQLCIPDLFEPPDHGKALADPFGVYDGYRVRGAGGRLVPVQVTASRLPTAPAPLALLVVREVRGQGTSNFLLAEDEGRVRDLFSVSPDAIFVEAFDGTILDVNAKACRLHGEPRERLVGRNVLDLVPTEQRDQVRASFPRLVSGELTFVEGFSRTADGRTVPVELRVSRVNYRGSPALLLHVRDVTPRKRAEESLRESKRFIERIAEASPHIMYVFDVVRRKSVYANRVIARDLGYTAEEVEAMGEEFLPRLLHPEDQARLPDLLGRYRAIRDGEVLEAEYRMRHRDGSWHWLLSRDTVFSRGPDGEVIQVIGTAEDVTARKRAEQEVLASKRMLEAVINNIPQGVFWKDRDSRYLGCNRVMAEAFGLGDPADIVGRTPFDMPALTPEQAASSLAEDRRVIEGGEGALDFDQAVTRADGSTIWLETSKLPLLDANGRVTGVIGTWQDVTERKRAQEALQRRNRLLASLSRCQARFIAGENQSAIFQELLLTLLEATGSEYGLLGEVLGGGDGLRYLKTLAITDISWDEGSSRLYRESKDRGLEFRNLETLFGAVITTGSPVVTNDPASHPGSGGRPPGHPPLRSFLGLPFHQGQEVVGMVGVANRPGGYDEGVVALLEPFLNTCAGLLVAARTDHARRTAEAQVRASERRYLTTLASIGDAVIATDPAGRVTFLNPVAEALTGWACAEAAGRPLDEVLPLLEEQSRRPVENPAGQALRLRAAVGLANGTLLVTRDGQEVPIEDSAAPIRADDGEVQGVVLVFRDVTARRQVEEQRRRLEAQLLHAQKLEGLGVLAGGIAHDFNNLLTGILGYTNLAAMRLPSGSEAGPLIAEAERAAHRAADLVRQLLAYAGKGRFVVQPIDLSALAGEMLSLLRTVVSRKAHVRTAFAPCLPWVEADATQLRQVVMNLITNASEALGDRGGEIALRTGEERVDDPRAYSPHASPEACPGQFVFLEVGDTGCGMDPETLARIFDPFFTTKFAGRGLGLAAVLGIVRGHRGLVRIVSSLGGGTRFRVLFPAAEAGAAQELVAAAGPLPAARPETSDAAGSVLVVDDEESVRSLAAHALRGAGYQVIVAADGEEGLAAFRVAGAKIGAVVMDLTMPGLDGLEATRQLYELRHDVPVVLMSGYGEPHVMANLAGTRFARFLQKPFVAESLLDAVREALNPRQG